MKKNLNLKLLPWLSLAAGIIGLALRFWQLSTENDRGFIVRGHISGILLIALTLVLLAVLVIAVQSLEQAGKYGYNFPASLSGGIGTCIGAVCFCVASMADLLAIGHNGATAWSAFAAWVTPILGILSAVSLIFVAKCRWKGQHPNTLFHIIVCFWLVLRLLSLYRQWSADPQVQDYCYPLLAMVCLMLSTYQRATFDANFGKRKLYTLFNLAGVYFCCLSLAGPEDILFYLGAGCWLFTDQCSLNPMPKEFLEKKKWNCPNSSENA